MSKKKRKILLDVCKQPTVTGLDTKVEISYDRCLNLELRANDKKPNFSSLWSLSDFLLESLDDLMVIAACGLNRPWEPLQLGHWHQFTGEDGL